MVLLSFISLISRPDYLPALRFYNSSVFRAFWRLKSLHCFCISLNSVLKSGFPFTKDCVAFTHMATSILSERQEKQKAAAEQHLHREDTFNMHEEVAEHPPSTQHTLDTKALMIAIHWPILSVFSHLSSSGSTQGTPYTPGQDETLVATWNRLI